MGIVEKIKIKIKINIALWLNEHELMDVNKLIEEGYRESLEDLLIVEKEEKKEEKKKKVEKVKKVKEEKNFKAEYIIQRYMKGERKGLSNSEILEIYNYYINYMYVKRFMDNRKKVW